MNNNNYSKLDFFDFYDHMNWTLVSIGQNSEGKRFYPQWKNSKNQYKKIQALIDDNPYSTMIGIPTEPNNLVVIDCDTDENGNEAGIENFKDIVVKENGGQLPDTLVVRSKSGGLHFYFSIDYSDNENCFISSANELGAHIDVRAKGGLIIGPWSKSKEGGSYDICNYPKDFIIPKLPDWLAKKLKKQNTNSKTYKFSSSFASADLRAYKLLNCYIEKLKIAKEGARNTLLSKYAGQAFRLCPQYLSSSEIFSKFTLVAKQLGLTDYEIQATLKSAERYGQSHSKYLR